MGDSFITIIAIFLAAILMFVFPLMTMADKNDDVSQLVVETATTEFVDNVRSTGVLTLDDYDAFVQEIAATGNAYQIEMEADLSDTNPNIKTTQVTTTKIGDTLYYSMYTSQIEDHLKTKDTLTFKEGDIFSTSVKNTNITIGQTLRNFFYQITGNNTYQVGTQHAGMVTVNGSK